jgi:alkylation response protein AidB-like acyl-CoA dehydrogenase
MSASLNFSISADQEALVKAARRFGEQHLAPFYKQRESEGAFDRQTLCHMGELGLFCVEQRLRDVLGLQIGDGTAQIMKVIIARHKGGPQSATT